MTEYTKGAVQTNPVWAAEVKAFNNAQTDWYGFCRHCGMRVEGTPAQLREHHCGPKG